ncbi:cleavage and polyadenylation specificity factor subunit 2, partial [Clonorchis sinensis]
VDEFHCLLDCGWSDGLDKEYVKRLTQWTRHIDAVLLSHQSLRHLGLLPFLVGSCGLKCPVYATTPVYKMGQLTLYDFYQSMYASEDFTAFTLDDVDAAFDLVVQVKYQQTINLPGRGRGLCITPLPSGHTLGGTIWKLVKEDTDIVYAVDFNHKKERHLNGATFDACMRPHLLIMDASNTMYTHPRRKDRDETLRHSILKTLRRGGNILVAVDTAGRCLEVAHFLEQCWLNQDSGMMAYGLAMLSFVAFNVVDFAKSMVEWMSEKVMRTFEDQRTNPFHFRHVQLCHTLEQLDTVPEPKVVLASASDLSCGFARQLFAEWADNDLNTVILTSRESCVVSEEPGDYTLLGRLIGLARGDAAARQGLPTSSTGTLVLPLSLSQRVSQTQYEQLKNELPRIRNAVQVGSTTLPSGASSSGALDVGAAIIPMPEGMDESGNTPGDDQNTDTDVNMDGGTSPPPPSAPFTLTTVQHTEHETSLLGLTSSFAHQPPMPSRRNNTLLNVDSMVDHNQSSQLTMPSGTQLTVGRHQPGYDIYPGLHNHAGGQFFRMTKRTQLLFPQVDRKIHWDEYGGHVDRDLFNTEDKLDSNTCTELKQKSQKVSQPILEDTTTSNLISPSILECLASKNFQFDDPETKTHVITHQLEIPLRCELLFLDYEGRSDGEAMKRIVVGLRPQELILVGNSRADTEQLATYCRTVMLLASNLVHTPSACSVINCTKEGDIYQARMKDSLVSSLRFTKIRDYELAWVEANIDLTDNASSDPDHSESASDDLNMPNASGDDNPPSPPKTRSSLAADRLPVLGLPTGPVGAHKTVFVNEPKLSDLKQLLLANGLVAEFVSGVLVVDNCVAIKRSEAGKLLLEGLLSRTYFTVRQVLYQQLEQVSKEVTLEVCRLVSKLEKRDLSLDALRESILEIQAPFAVQHRCQEDSLTFEELSKRVESHPRGWLILCLAAENKELEQLQAENRTLLDSLDKHQSALDLIMKKYRLQVSSIGCALN